MVDGALWKKGPEKYGRQRREKEAPAEFRDSWQQNKDQLKDLYQAAIFSDNDSAGNLIAYVYTHSMMAQKGSNPITAFNNWLHDEAGLNQPTGLKSWLSGAPNIAADRDDRYGQLAFLLRRKRCLPPNTFS